MHEEPTVVDLNRWANEAIQVPMDIVSAETMVSTGNIENLVKYFTSCENTQTSELFFSTLKKVANGWIMQIESDILIDISVASSPVFPELFSCWRKNRESPMVHDVG